jgi:hypothetical protein
MSRSWKAQFAGVALVLGCWLAGAHVRAAEPPHTGRVWLYAATTVKVSPGLSLTLMPGIRTELGRSAGASAGHFMDELFVGPNLHWKWAVGQGEFGLALSLWYYFTGLPVASSGAYHHTHSFELIPTLSYRRGAFSLSSRTIFHSTVWASVYESTSARSGYGLVVREMLSLRYQLAERWALLLAGEPFFGAIEDREAEPSLLGFWPRGVRLNRVYAGAEVKLRPGFSRATDKVRGSMARPAPRRRY